MIAALLELLREWSGRRRLSSGHCFSHHVTVMKSDRDALEADRHPMRPAPAALPVEPWRKRPLMHAAGVLQVPGLTSAMALFREMFVHQMQVALRGLIGNCKWCEIGNGASESLGKEF